MPTFEVRAIEEMLVLYEVEAKDYAEAVGKLEDRGVDDGVREVSSEYYDFGRVYDVHDENGNEIEVQ